MLRIVTREKYSASYLIIKKVQRTTDDTIVATEKSAKRYQAAILLWYQQEFQQLPPPATKPRCPASLLLLLLTLLPSLPIDLAISAEFLSIFGRNVSSFASSSSSRLALAADASAASPAPAADRPAPDANKCAVGPPSAMAVLTEASSSSQNCVRASVLPPCPASADVTRSISSGLRTEGSALLTCRRHELCSCVCALCLSDFFLLG